MPVWLWWVVLAVNAVTVVLFAWDKFCAMRRWRRVPEATLIGWTFATGCIGAWCAMSLFRHKTTKTSFRRRALVATVLNPLWALCWWQFAA